MTTQLCFEDSRLQRMEQATLWLQRMRSASADERVVDAWLDWCQHDPLNQQAFDEIAAVWELSGHLATEPVPAAGPVHSRRAIVAAAAGVGMVIGAGALWLMRPQPLEVVTSEYSSPVGINRRYTLADGSVLELGGASRVTVKIGPRERRVQLHEGELYITVQHEAIRPFLVAVERLEVIATGTAFNVLRTTGRTVVTVAEGSVYPVYDGQRVELQDKLLRTGQQLVLVHGSRKTTVRMVNPAYAIAWRSGMLSFNGEPLAEVIDSINRYSARPFVIQDARIRAFPYLGNAHTDAVGISEWRDGLPLINQFPFPVTVVEHADGSRLIAPRSVARD